jgi:hypothetical protein
MEHQVEVGAAGGWNIERSVLVRLQRMLPEHNEEQEPEHAVYDVLDIDRSELTAGDTTAQDGGNKAEATVHGRLRVEPGQLR